MREVAIIMIGISVIALLVFASSIHDRVAKLETIIIETTEHPAPPSDRLTVGS